MWARRHGGRWNSYNLADSAMSAWGMMMPTAREAEEVIDWVRAGGGDVQDEERGHNRQRRSRRSRSRR